MESPGQEALAPSGPGEGLVWLGVGRSREEKEKVKWWMASCSVPGLGVLSRGEGVTGLVCQLGLMALAAWRRRCKGA